MTESEAIQWCTDNNVTISFRTADVNGHKHVYLSFRNRISIGNSIQEAVEKLLAQKSKPKNL